MLAFDFDVTIVLCRLGNEYGSLKKISSPVSGIGTVGSR